MDYRVTNIKVSVKSQNICLDTAVITLQEKDVIFKKYSNYIVVQSKFTYVIFKPKIADGLNHINITKIPCMEEIENAKQHLCDLFKIEILRVHVVDNITVSTKLENKCIPSEIIQQFKNYCKITFNQETFPGVFLKFSYGTAIVFHTGRCILIGCKSIENIEKTLKVMETVLKENG
jgi:Transcription factor TFIID (or TATA-binding protein, TBP)